MLQIVVPMAGRGSRFSGLYDAPKPLIKIHGKEMISVVINNLRPRQAHRFIFLCLREHLDRYPLAALLQRCAPGCAIVPVETVTEGAACTVLLAERYIGGAEPLMIANCDQWVDTDVNAYLEGLAGRDGLIMTMNATGNKWSYVALEGGRVTRVAEKEPISDEATVGIYNYARGADFVRAARAMIVSNDRVNGEFYVAPVYNYLIAEGADVGIVNVGLLASCMHGLGTPEDLSLFLQKDISRAACQF